MPTLIMTKGLPASGKTTWAKLQVEKNPLGIKRVNKDSLRAMLHAGVWNPALERVILQARDTLVTMALLGGWDVIVDDTNLAPKHEAALRHLAADCCAQFRIVPFDADVETCLQRDAARPAGEAVGRETILEMYWRYVAPTKHKVVPPHIPGAPEAVICDIDGTIAEMTGRSPYDMTRVSEDVVRQKVLDIVLRVAEGRHLFFFTGRDRSGRGDTVIWLDKALTTPKGRREFDLVMREPGDKRPDEVVKQEMYTTHIDGKYNVAAVFDDRPKVVRLWRNLGLPIFDVGEGIDF